LHANIDSKKVDDGIFQLKQEKGEGQKSSSELKYFSFYFILCFVILHKNKWGKHRKNENNS
jgi:hypothetical protein